MDWSGCDLVEIVPGKVSGVPLLRGTRLPADVVVANFDAGCSLEEIAENYPSASVGIAKALIAYAQAQRGCAIS